MTDIERELFESAQRIKRYCAKRLRKCDGCFFSRTHDWPPCQLADKPPKHWHIQNGGMVDGE